MGSQYRMGVGFHSGKLKNFWRRRVVVVPQQCVDRSAHPKMATVVNFVPCIFFFFFSTFIYFWDRERQSMNGGRAEREGDTELETGSRL